MNEVEKLKLTEDEITVELQKGIENILSCSRISLKNIDRNEIIQKIQSNTKEK